MLQQILRDMYIDPEILEELSDDQKQILFFKMREEQIRRWKHSEEMSLEEEKMKPRPTKRSTKNVNFYCDGDSNLIIDYIKEEDEIDVNDLKKKQEEEALKRAGVQARNEAAQKRKELDEMEEKRREELKKKEEAERLKREKEEKEDQAKRKSKEEVIYHSLKAAKLQKEKEEAEKKFVEEKKRTEEEQHKKEEEQRRKQEEGKKREEASRLKDEDDKKKREEQLAEEERLRKEEIYQSMKKEQEERRMHEEEECKRLEDEWQERELKAKEADQQRRHSFSYSKGEFERMRKLAKEKTELEKLRKTDTINELPNIDKMSVDGPSTPAMSESAEPTTCPVSTIPATQAATISTPSKSRSFPAKRPPLPSRPETLPRPTISNPVNVTSTRDEIDTIHVQKELVKPSRPPPPPSKGSPNITRGENKEVVRRDKSNRPPRPKSKMEVITWWKEIEYAKLSGLDEDKKPMEWFHGVITRHEAEKILANKKQGSYLVRVSERVWGYTISFKDIGRCKHFLIDTVHGGYQFFGMEQIVHNTLNELIEYHGKYPISGLGQEVLIYPCGQEKSRPDYEHLFVDNTVI